METYPGADTPSVTLSVLAGVGARGERITHLLEDLVASLPEPLKAAIRVVHGADAAALLQQVRAARASLTDQVNTERILAGKWQVEGRDTGGVRVQLCIAAAEGEDAGLDQTVRTLQNDNGSDTIRTITIATNPVDVTPAGEARGVRRYFVGPRNAAGETTGDDAIIGSVAGALLLFALPGSRPGPDPTEDRAATFGLSAFHGVIGASRRQLARHLAAALLAIHGRPASEVDQQRFQGQDLAEFVQDHSLETLLPRLFDPRLFDTGRTEPIPAVPQIDDNRLVEITLDRGAVALKLAPGEETLWSEQLVRYSRTLEMTVAVRWRRQMESAFRNLARTVPDALVERVRTYVARTVNGHALMRDALERVRTDHEHELLSLPDPSARLEPALRELDHAVAARPGALDLWLRTALWVLPAAGAAALVLTRLMDDDREKWFALGVAVLVAAAGVLGVVQRLDAARQRILKSRDRAVAIILDRQEAILSQNAVGYVQDLVALLRRGRESALEFLAKDEEAITVARRTLDEALARPVEGPVTFEPVLRTRKEYEEAHRLLNANTDQLLEGLGGEDGLSPQAVQIAHNMALPEWLTTWCDARIVEGRAVRPIPFSSAWEIRLKGRPEGNVHDELAALQRRAEPLGSVEMSCKQMAMRVVPAGVPTEGMEPATEEVGGLQEVVEVPSPHALPLFVCWKGALLRPHEGTR